MLPGEQGLHLDGSFWPLQALKHSSTQDCRPLNECVLCGVFQLQCLQAFSSVRSMTNCRVPTERDRTVISITGYCRKCFNLSRNRRSWVELFFSLNIIVELRWPFKLLLLGFVLTLPVPVVHNLDNSLQNVLKPCALE